MDNKFNLFRLSTRCLMMDQVCLAMQLEDVRLSDYFVIFIFGKILGYHPTDFKFESTVKSEAFKKVGRTVSNFNFFDGLIPQIA